MRVYVDGVQRNTLDISGQPGDLQTTEPFRIGNRKTDIENDLFFNGIIDEARVSNVARSTAWIKATYESGRDDLIAYGSEETRVIIERFQEEGTDFRETKFGATWT